MEHSRSTSLIPPEDHDEDDDEAKSEERDSVLDLEAAQKVVIEPPISAHFREETKQALRLGLQGAADDDDDDDIISYRTGSSNQEEEVPLEEESGEEVEIL